MWSGGSGSGPQGALQPQSQDVVDLQDQFEQQQTMISQLKETLHKNQQHLLNKGKQAEEYAAKLSNIKSRSKASKRGLKRDVPSESTEDDGKEMEEQSIQKKVNTGVEEQLPRSPSTESKTTTPGPKTDKGRQGNLHLLRKKLEENRMKFEQRGKDNTDNKRIEEMVEHLKSQLNERDQVIKELQRNFESPKISITEKQSTPPSAEEPIQQIEEIHEEEIAEPNPLQEELYQLKNSIHDLHTTIECKDNIITELNDRIVSLENNILDLQENLKEKDQVIDARTKAITLMSEDLSRKGKTTLDTLEETREQMRLMQQNFVALETRMKQEKEQLNKEIEAKDKKLSYLEDSNKKLESVRFELSTRNAELQEKVVRLQEHCSELQNQNSQDKESNVKVEELTKSLEIANKQLIKIKAQHKNKVKNLTSQIENLKSASDGAEEIMKLQNKVAELEEDKGNLQLQMVDFDDLKALESQLREKVCELETLVEKQKEELNGFSHAVSLLESEKEDLLWDIKDTKNKVALLEQEVLDLKSVINDTENEKVALELKSVELEEQVDTIVKEKVELIEELQNKTSELSSVTEKLKVLEEREHFSSELKVQTDENKSNKSFEDLSVSAHIDEEELSDAKLIIQNQQDLIKELESKVEINEAKISEQEEVIDMIEELQQKKQEQQFESFSEVCRDLRDVTADLQEWKKRCEEVETRLISLDNEKTSLEEGFEEIRKENEVLSSELQDKKVTIDNLTDKLREQKDALAERDEQIRNLQEMIEETGLKLKDRELALENVYKTLENMQEEYDAKYIQFEVAIVEKDNKFTEASHSLAKANELLEVKDSEINMLRQEIDNHKLRLERMEHDLSVVNETTKLNLEDRLSELSQLLEKKNQANLILIKDVENLRETLESKNVYIDKLQLGLKDAQEIESQFETTLAELRSAKEELDILKSSLQSKTSELDVALKDIEDLKTKNKEKTEKMKKLAANLKVKALSVKNCEEKIQQLEMIIQNKDSDITKLQEELENKNESLNHVNRLLEENTNLLNEEQRKIDRLNAEILSLTCQVEDFNTQLSASSTYSDSGTNVKNEQLILHENENNRSKEDIEELTKELSRLLNENSYKENKLAELTERISLLTNQIEELEIGKTEKSCRIQELEANLHEVENRYKHDVEEQKEELCRLLNESVYKENKMAELMERISLLTKQNEELEANLHKVENKFKQDMEELIEELSRLLNDNSCKENKLAELKERISLLTNRNKELEISKSEKSCRIVELEDEAESRDINYVGTLGKVECLENIIEDREKLLERKRTSSKHHAEQMFELEHEVLGRDLRIVELEEQVSQTEDRYYQAWLVAQAKIHERDAVIEALEHTLAKTQERVVALGDSLSNIEERRKSLEGKAEILSDKLEESNREKEVVIETEEILELKLNELMKTEQNFKEKLQKFKENEAELIEKNKDLADENKELHRTILSLESGVKEMQHEIERLVGFESAYEEEMLKVESLKSELRQVSLDHEREMIDRIEEMKQYVICLESELKEKTERMEIMRKELLSQSVEMRSEFSDGDEQKSLGIEHLEEKLFASNTEIHLLKEEIIFLQDRIEMVLSEQQETNKELAKQESLLKSFEEKNKMLGETLAQKEIEIKSYQSRMLQLQFNKQSPINEEYERNLSQLQDEIKHLNESASSYSYEIETLKKMLFDKENEKRDLETELIEQREETKLVRSNSEVLEVSLTRKDGEINKLLDSLNERESKVAELEALVSTLELKLNDIMKELCQEKAKNEVENIIVEAEETVQKIKTVVGTCDAATVTNLQDVSPAASGNVVNESVPETARFFDLFSSPQVPEDDQMNFIGGLTGHCSGECIIRAQQLEDRISELEAELVILKSERDSALKDIEELTQQLNMPHLDETDGTPVPVTEDVCVKNSAYLTFEPDVPDSSASSVPEHIADVSVASVSEPRLISVFQDNDKDDAWNLVFSETIQEDEEWGWGSDEARLEEEHLLMKQQEGNQDDLTQVREKIFLLENHIQELVLDKERMAEEIKEMQDRNAKLLKKLKDLKLKNDSLLKENLELNKKITGSGFGDLDSAIEEELKIRIDSLEKEIKDMKNEKESMKLEKDSLLKRLDVLASANDRLVEMKERQDIEMQICQQKNRELTNQVQALEWKVEEETVTGKDIESDISTFKESSVNSEDTSVCVELKKKLQESQEQLLALEDDNYNLQNLLEEQRQLRLVAERVVTDLESKIRRLLSAIGDSASNPSDIDDNEKYSSADNMLLYIEHRFQDLSSASEKKDFGKQQSEHIGETSLESEKSNSFKTVDFSVFEDTTKSDTFEVSFSNDCSQQIRRELDSLSEQLEVVKKELDERNKKCEELSSQVSDKNEEIHKLTEECQNMKSKYEDESRLAKEEILLLKSGSAHSKPEKESSPLFKTFTMGSPVDEAEDLKTKISDQERIIAELQETISRKSEEIASLSRIIDSLQEEKLIIEQQFKENVTQLTQHLDTAKSALADEKHRREVEVQELHEKLWLNDSARQNQIDKIIQEKEDEVKLLKAQYEEKESHLQKLLYQKDEEIKNLKNEADRLRSENSEFKMEETPSQDSNAIKLERMLEEQKLASSKIISAREQDIENLKIQITEIQKELDEKIFLKDKDIENLNILLNEKEVRLLEVSQTLKQQISERDNKLLELSKELDEEEKQLVDMQEIIDEKNAEIEQLKLHIVHISESSSSASAPVDKSAGERPEQSVEKNELDLALYMLHQRDVRIDELTLELMQLLEERDTLQLRLSTAIRLNEELRAKASKSTPPPPPSSPCKVSSPESSSQGVPVTQPEVPSDARLADQVSCDEPKEDLHALENKLSQLHSVGYLRDVTLKDEREQRHIEQMSLLHHRGSSVLVDANYTLSRDVQSPSKVIFNWIRGRSTPKEVMHV